jgi:hypothetical protein
VRLALIALAVLLIVSCTSSVPAMRITRFSTSPAHHYPAFDRSVVDPVVTRRVYDAVRALPPAPSVCFPETGYGLSYRLSFNDASRVILSVVVEGDGCVQVTFSDADRRATDDAFWDLLADTLGVKKTEILFVLPDEVRR